jgi:hypothetical protein
MIRRIGASAVVIIVLVLLCLWQRTSSQEPRSVRVLPADETSDTSLVKPHTPKKSPRPEGVEQFTEARRRPRLRDLADGAGAPGIQVIVVRDGREIVLESDRDGFIEMPERASEPTAVATPSWKLLKPGASPDDNSVWVYKLIPISGTVRVLERNVAPPTSEVRVRFLIDLRLSASDLACVAARDPVVERQLGSPGPDGTFDGEIPRVAGATVVASCSGYRPARQALEVSRGTEWVSVYLEMARAFTIGGVLRSSDGTPLEGVAVGAYMCIPMRAEDSPIQTAKLLAPDGGVGAAVDLTTGQAYVKFMWMVRTDKAGRFELPIEVDGDFALVAYVPGHRPLEREFDALRRSLDDVELMAERVSTTKLRFVSANEPVCSTRIEVVDMTLVRGEAQPGFYFTTDNAGLAPSEWFVAGRCYYLTHAGLSGEFRYSDQQQTDLARDLQPVGTYSKR